MSSDIHFFLTEILLKYLGNSVWVKSLDNFVRRLSHWCTILVVQSFLCILKKKTFSKSFGSSVVLRIIFPSSLPLHSTVNQTKASSDLVEMKKIFVTNQFFFFLSFFFVTFTNLSFWNHLETILFRRYLRIIFPSDLVENIFNTPVLPCLSSLSLLLELSMLGKLSVNDMLDREKEKKNWDIAFSNQVIYTW